MKIRSGFVSNSSSSSFILITDLVSHDLVLDAMRKKKDGKELAKLIDYVIGHKTLGEGEIHHMDVDIVVLHTGSGEMSYYSDPIFNWKGLEQLPPEKNDHIDLLDCLTDADKAELEGIKDDEERKEAEAEILSEIHNVIYSAQAMYEETIKELGLPHISTDMNL